MASVADARRVELDTACEDPERAVGRGWDALSVWHLHSFECGQHCGAHRGHEAWRSRWARDRSHTRTGSVFGNGGVLDAAGSVVFEAALPSQAAEVVRAYTLNGRANGGRRLAVLAATRWQAGEPYSHHYVELAPCGDTFCTQLIKNAAEPAIQVAEYPAQLPSILKYVIFTDPKDAAWASMPETVASLRSALDGTGAVVLDCGASACEVFAPGVNKGSGVARLLEHLKVPATEAMALGDAENDVEMLRLVGTGVAMGNANEHARGAADVVVGTSDQDGVAEAVRRFVLGLEGSQSGECI